MSNIKQLIDGVAWSAVKTGKSIGRQAAAHEKQARVDYAAGRLAMTKQPDWRKYSRAQHKEIQRAAADGAETIELDKHLMGFHESARPAIKELLRHIFREKAELASAHFCDQFMGRGQ